MDFVENLILFPMVQCPEFLWTIVYNTTNHRSKSVTCVQTITAIIII